MRYVAHNQVYRLQEHSPVLQSRYEMFGRFIEITQMNKSFTYYYQVETRIVKLNIDL